MKNIVLLGIATIISTVYTFFNELAFDYAIHSYTVIYIVIVQFIFPIVIGLLVGLLGKEIVHEKKDGVALFLILLLNILISVFIYSRDVNISIYNIFLVGYILARMLTIIIQSLRVKQNSKTK